MIPPKIKIFFFCPVPETQKPIGELISFQENSFFSWITFSKKQYQRKLLSIFCFFFILSFFFLSPFPSFFLFEFSVSILSSSFFCLIIFLFAFFSWSAIENRLNFSRLIYEEGSWYDAQIWEKPLSLIKNEKLISTQKIQPILQRISFSLFFFFFFTTFSSLLVIFQN
jgi:hypothetical protein